MPNVLILLAAVLLPARNAALSPVLRPVSLAQNQAAAERSSIDLAWSVPAGCPDGDAVRADAIQLAGTTTPGSRHLKVRASIRPAAGTAWMLSLTTDLDGVTGERALSGTSCESLAQAAVLMLALILNPDLPLTAAPAVPPLQPARQADTAASASDRRPLPRWRVGAHGGIQQGVLRALSSSFAITFGAALGRLSLRLIPGFSLPQNVYVDPEQKLGGRLWLGTASGLGCWSAALGWLALSPCLGVEVTRLQGKGLGVLQPREAPVYWSSAEFALFLGLPVGRGVHLELGGLGMLPFHRPTVYLDGIGPVSRPAVFGVRALGGLAWLFW